MEEKKVIEMSAAEAAEFEKFREAKNLEAAQKKEKEEREEYRMLVDTEIENAIPMLACLSESLGETKAAVLENFNAVIQLKGELLRVKEDQKSHTFTNSDGTKRITIGFYVTDAYRDTVDEGIAIIKNYITSLVKDEKTQALVSMVLKLLAKDAKGTLKASRVMQLKKIAEEMDDDEFMRGVTIIEEAYQPAKSKQFIKAEIKGANNEWVSIPLGMTEA